MIKKRKILILSALVAMAIGAQAQVTFKPATIDNGVTNGLATTTNAQTYIFTDVATLVNTPCEGATNKVSGFFSAGTGSFAVTVTAASGFIMNDAVNNINTNSFGTYLNGLSNELVNINSDDWGATSATNDISLDKLSNSEVLIYDFDLSDLAADTELSLNQIKLTQAGIRESLFVYLYHSASNAVVYNSNAFEDDKVAHSFTNRIYDGDRLVLATRDSRDSISVPLADEKSSTVRIDWMSLDTYAPPLDILSPVYITDATASNKKVVLNWGDDGNQALLDHYNVWRSLESNGIFNVVGESTTSTYTDGDVDNGVTNYYYVTAYGTDHVETTNLNVVSAMPFMAVPTGLTAVEGDGTVGLTWDDMSTVEYFSSYSLYRSKVSGSGYTSIASNLTTTTYTDDGVMNNRTYYYVISQVDIDGDESDFSAPLSAQPTEALIVTVADDALQASAWVTWDAVAGRFLTNGVNVETKQVKCGHFSNGDSSQIRRPIIKFPLTEVIRPASDIKAVTLRLKLSENQLENMRTNNVVDVYASQTEAANIAVVASDFENTNYTLIGTWSDITTNSLVGEWYEFDVTTTVMADMTNDDPADRGSCFRLQIRDDTDLNKVTAEDWVVAKFNDNSDGVAAYHPQLKIAWKDSRPFVRWSETWGTADVSVDTNDYDADGINNLAEYVFDGDPTNALVQGTMPTLLDAGGELVYVYPQRAGDARVLYTVQTKTDLQRGAWTNTGTMAISTNLTGDTLNFVTNSVDTVDDKRFIRILLDYNNE